MLVATFRVGSSATAVGTTDVRNGKRTFIHDELASWWLRGIIIIVVQLPKPARDGGRSVARTEAAVRTRLANPTLELGFGLGMGLGLGLGLGLWLGLGLGLGLGLRLGLGLGLGHLR
jgi:hypothetical protein